MPDPYAEARAFRDWLLPRMVASINASEHEPLRRAGCLEGVELCRNIESPEHFTSVLTARHAREAQLIREYTDTHTAQTLDAYWYYHYATAQVEYVQDHLKLVWPGDSRLASVLVSASSVRDLQLFTERN